MDFKVVVLLLCSIVYAGAIVCPTNYCETNDCTSDVEDGEDCPDDKVPMPTFCGCCTKCVDGKGPGEACDILRGIPETPCGPGLTCVDHKCVPTDPDEYYCDE